MKRDLSLPRKKYNQHRATRPGERKKEEKQREQGRGPGHDPGKRESIGRKNEKQFRASPASPATVQTQVLILNYSILHAIFLLANSWSL
jgi:hypothetical protein